MPAEDGPTMTKLCLALIAMSALLPITGGRALDASLAPMATALLVLAAGLAVAARLPRDEMAKDGPPPARGQVVRRFGAPRDRR